MKELPAMNKRGLLVTFAGIDGSGKTTLAKNLAKWLSRNGLECRYTYCGLVPVLLRPIIFIGQTLFLRGRDIFADYGDYSGAKSKAIKKSPFLATIYQRLLLFDYYMQVFIKIKLPLMRGKNIICDRYIYDTLVTNLAVDFGYSEAKMERTLKRFFRFLPRPGLAFLVDVPAETAFGRKKDTPSVEYVRQRRTAYLRLAEFCGMTIIDASQGLIQVEADVQAKVSEVI